MIGMAIAVATTLLLRLPTVTGLILVVIGAGLGGSVGAFVAKRIEMTKMPQLVAFFHSLVGLAAVLVAASAFFAPQAFGIGSRGNIEAGSLIEMSLGAAIGAITFTGSVIAFLKLDERMTGKPILLPERHTINIVLGVALFALILLFATTESGVWLFLLVLASFTLGVTLIIPIGGADMPVVVSMLNSYSGWGSSRHWLHARQSRADHHRRARRLIGRDPFLHHVQGHNRSFVSVILGGFGGETGRPRGHRRKTPGQAGLGG